MFKEDNFNDLHVGNNLLSNAQKVSAVRVIKELLIHSNIKNI